jgi:hypothetical protein
VPALDGHDRFSASSTTNPIDEPNVVSADAANPPGSSS